MANLVAAWILAGVLILAVLLLPAEAETTDHNDDPDERPIMPHAGSYAKRDTAPAEPRGTVSGRGLVWVRSIRSDAVPRQSPNRSALTIVREMVPRKVRKESLEES